MTVLGGSTTDNKGRQPQHYTYGVAMVQYINIQNDKTTTVVDKHQHRPKIIMNIQMVPQQLNMILL